MMDDVVKQLLDAAPYVYDIQPGTLMRAAEEIKRLRALLNRVLDANIARGCASHHPRIGLVYDIQEATAVGSRL
jgi:hypothetical protein